MLPMTLPLRPALVRIPKRAGQSQDTWLMHEYGLRSDFIIKMLTLRDNERSSIRRKRSCSFDKSDVLPKCLLRKHELGKSGSSCVVHVS